MSRSQCHNRFAQLVRRACFVYNLHHFLPRSQHGRAGAYFMFHASPRSLQVRSRRSTNVPTVAEGLPAWKRPHDRRDRLEKAKGDVVTEADWLECDDPDKMLRLRLLRHKLSDRKKRLFACACCRRIWHLLTDHRSRAAVEVAERYADGLVTRQELSAARDAVRHAVTSPVLACDALLGPGRHCSPGPVAAGVALVGHRSLRAVSHFTALFVEEVAGDSAVFKAERAAQARVCRELFGNPFRPVSIDPRWLVANDGLVPRIAKAIYDERGFERLPVLADALEKAGCDDAEMLAHCRLPGDHVRGCWVVDLLIGKE